MKRTGAQSRAAGGSGGFLPGRVAGQGPWPAAAALSAAVAVWFILVGPEPQYRAFKTPEPPRVWCGLVSGADAEGTDAAVALWSPVLFSLPSPVGFSATAMRSSGMPRTQLRPPVIESVLEPGGPFVTASLTWFPVAPARPWRKRIESPAAAPLPDPFKGHTPGSPERVRWFTPESAAEVSYYPWPAVLDEVAGSGAVLARLKVDRAGVPRQVLIERVDGEAPAGELARSLYRWRWQHGEPRLVRVGLYYGERAGGDADGAGDDG